MFLSCRQIESMPHASDASINKWYFIFFFHIYLFCRKFTIIFLNLQIYLYNCVFTCYFFLVLRNGFSMWFNDFS